MTVAVVVEIFDLCLPAVGEANMSHIQRHVAQEQGIAAVVSLLIHPEMMRIVLLRATSILLVWVILAYTGAQYSATEYTKAIAEIRRTLKSAPQERPASRLMRQLRALAFCASCVRCC